VVKGMKRAETKRMTVRHHTRVVVVSPEKNTVSANGPLSNMTATTKALNAIVWID
jgi:hypothetical protein